MPDTFTRQDMTTPTPLDPTLYHAHHILRADDLPFWHALAEEFKDPILELGCGTGRILLSLAGMGYHLTGLDNDPNMLSYLRRNKSEETANHSINIHEKDMRNFALTERFALTILPCNTYTTFQSHERRQIAQTVHRHLMEGGIFAFSVPNPHLLASLDILGEFDLEETFPHPNTSHPVEVYSKWQRTPDQITFTWRYDHKYPNGKTISHITSTQHHLDTPEMYLEELNDAGLIPFAQFGDHEQTPFDPDESTYFIVLAKTITKTHYDTIAS
ncbi:MAG: class I SAM-dependent methyltransferase [Anaerolineae bacterium]|nr:class I SAM-dependent methyltransferase [Anaerolineae bacterium]